MDNWESVYSPNSKVRHLGSTPHHPVRVTIEDYAHLNFKPLLLSGILGWGVDQKTHPRWWFQPIGSISPSRDENQKNFLKLPPKTFFFGATEPSKDKWHPCFLGTSGNFSLATFMISACTAGSLKASLRSVLFVFGGLGLVGFVCQNCLEKQWKKHEKTWKTTWTPWKKTIKVLITANHQPCSILHVLYSSGGKAFLGVFSNPTKTLRKFLASFLHCFLYLSNHKLVGNSWFTFFGSKCLFQNGEPDRGAILKTTDFVSINSTQAFCLISYHQH